MMTEKRYISNIHRIYDDNEEIACADTIDDAEVIVNLLNDQDEQIQELLSCNHGLAQKQIRMFDKIIQLEKENKMLKITIMRNEGYIRRIKSIGKFSNTSDVK